MTIVISTQAASNDDLLSILLDDALRGEDTRVVCHLYTADPARSDVELFKITWRPPSPAAECKAKQPMVACHTLHDAVDQHAAVIPGWSPSIICRIPAQPS